MSITAATFPVMGNRVRPKVFRNLRIKDWREYRGLTQEQLAERVGVRNTTISRWELYHPDKKDTRAPSVLEQLVLSEALGIEPADLHRDPYDRQLAGVVLPADEDSDLWERIRAQSPEVRQRVRRVVEALIEGEGVPKDGVSE